MPASNTFNNTNPLTEILVVNFVEGFNAEQAGASTVVTYADGTVLPAVPVGYGEVSIDSAVTSPIVLPASYPVLFDNTTAVVTVIGNGGGVQAVVAASGGLAYDFNGGGGVLYTGNAPIGGIAATGDAIFLSGVGVRYVAAGQGRDTIIASGGTNIIAVGGGANTVLLTGGSNLVATEGADQIVLGVGGVAALGSSTISLSGNASVYGGSGSLLLLNGGGNSFLFPQTDGVSGRITSTGSATVFGGAGGGGYYGGANGNNVMVAGEQATTLVGGGGNDALYAFGAGNDVLEANGANSFLIGTAAAGNNTYFAGRSDAYIAGGAGVDTFVVGSGNSTLVSGAGTDRYELINGQAGGFDGLFNFKVGIDQVYLFGYDADGVSAAANALQQAAANASGGSTFVTLADHTTLYFFNAPQLNANTFVG